MGLLKKKQSASEVLRIPLKDIRPNREQPRAFFEEGALSSLAESIRRYGVLQPISVRAAEDGYEIIAGERRFRAAKMAGLSHVPCIVYAVDGEKGAFLAVVENLLREDLNMFETAVAMDKLCREHGLTQEEVAERLSVSQSYVANKVRLLRFDATMREKLLSSGLTERHARALLRLPPALWEETADKIIARHANVETAERMIEEILSKGEIPRKTQRTRAKGVLRDVKVFYNSVDRAVEMVRRCGVRVQTEKREEAGATCLIIRIPKSG
ncbi:MAG: ParB/RepB/Spo0J family partition protein [Ruminococcaceae bacterium]|nr:ParB/RepB/Spo0J family partition protein [Oscillospiraceae bacterium]